MTRARLTALTALILGLTLAVTPGSAADKKAAGSNKPKVVAGGLDNPSGVAVQEGTGHLLVASHGGVFRIDPKGKGRQKKKLEVTGFPTDVYGKGPKYNIGPLGVAFLKPNLLVVGDGSRKDGAELVRIYRIGNTAPKKPQKEQAAVMTLGPISPSEDSPKGEGNFYGVAIGAGAIFVTCNGDDTKGWVSRSTLNDSGKPGKLKPYIKTKVATGVDAPVGITFTPDGKQLCVSQMGEMNVPGDSLLTFYNPSTGELIAKHKTGLHDIAGVAYSPKTGKIYVVDYAWAKNEDGGLYCLSVTDKGVEAKKIAKLDRPTALAFGKDGSLYVTVFGWGKNKKGAVVRFAPGL